MKKQTVKDHSACQAEFEAAREEQQAAHRLMDEKESAMSSVADERDKAAIRLGKAMQVVERLQKRLARKKKAFAEAAEAFADARGDWRVALQRQDDKLSALMKSQSAVAK